jgi:hypothetical protein
MKRIFLFSVFVFLLLVPFVYADELVLQPGSEGKDGYIRKDDPTKCFGTSKNLDAGQFWHNSAHRLLLRFDLSELPHNANISSAELKLWMYNDGPNKDVQLNVHRITRDWEEGTKGYHDNGATWNTYDGVNSWNTPGGDFDPLIIASRIVKTQNQYYSWDVTDLVIAWKQGSYENYGMILKGEDEQSDIQKRKRFRSSDYGTQSQRPQLIINYNLGPCIPLTCLDLGYECGLHDDGCGGSVECGNCSEGYFCEHKLHGAF